MENQQQGGAQPANQQGGAPNQGAPSNQQQAQPAQGQAPQPQGQPQQMSLLDMFKPEPAQPANPNAELLEMVASLKKEIETLKAQPQPQPQPAPQSTPQPQSDIQLLLKEFQDLKSSMQNSQTDFQRKAVSEKLLADIPLEMQGLGALAVKQFVDAIPVDQLGDATALAKMGQQYLFSNHPSLFRQPGNRLSSTQVALGGQSVWDGITSFDQVPADMIQQIPADVVRRLAQGGNNASQSGGLPKQLFPQHRKD